ncbi:hypothetical protein PSD17_10230 [Pseudonocardia sp. D17]|nr:hypothetical protein PSD17_10230 [Pseudonocardia sp. D17]
MAAGLSQGPVVVCLGERVSRVTEPSDAVAALPARQIAEVRDTTDAGDMFTELFAGALPRGSGSERELPGVTAALLGRSAGSVHEQVPRRDALEGSQEGPRLLPVPRAGTLLLDHTAKPGCPERRMSTASSWSPLVAR